MSPENIDETMYFSMYNCTCSLFKHLDSLAHCWFGAEIGTYLCVVEPFWHLRSSHLIINCQVPEGLNCALSFYHSGGFTFYEKTL